MDLQIKGSSVVCGVKVPSILGGFGPNKKSLLGKFIGIMHEKTTRHVNEAVNNNRSRFVDGVDVMDLKLPGHERVVADLVDNNFITKMEVAKAESILAFSERGYAKLLKIFDDDLAWDKYEEILDGYFRSVEDKTVDTATLSPTLQMFKQLWDGLAQKELDDMRRDNEIKSLREGFSTIKETLLQRDEDWRKSINGMLNSAAYRLGGKYGDLRSESYKILEGRAHCDLNRRLRNLKDRLSDKGATKTKVEGLSRMDVIDSDPKLREIYTIIVKELSIGSLKIAK